MGMPAGCRPPGRGFARPSPLAHGFSSASPASSRPLSMLNMRWMVQMHAGVVSMKLVALQVLDDVFLAKLVVVVGRVLVETLLGLAAQVPRSTRNSMRRTPANGSEAVDEADGGEGLATAGGHLDQGAGLLALRDCFQVGMAVICAGHRPW